jgi:hypothetical protein
MGDIENLNTPNFMFSDGGCIKEAGMWKTVLRTGGWRTAFRFMLKNFLENREKMKTKMHYIHTTLV